MDAMAGNREHLLGRFFQRLCVMRPASVLDVGCGNGRLLELCRDAAIPAEGVEADPETVRKVAARGLAVRQGDATALPAGNNSHDWVTLRHVLHHLEEGAVAGALDEAFRVARTGVLVAEPWHDTGVPSQALARRIDAWMKRQDRRLGRTHGDNLGASQILALLPADADFDIDCDYHVRLREQPLEELMELAAPLLAELPGDDARRREFEALCAQARRNGATRGGTMMLTMRYRGRCAG